MTSSPRDREDIFGELQLFRGAEVFFAHRNAAAPLADKLAIFDQLLVIVETRFKDTNIVQEAKMLLVLRMGHRDTGENVTNQHGSFLLHFGIENYTANLIIAPRYCQLSYGSHLFLQLLTPP